MPRLFVALELPAHAKRDLERLRGGIPGARWITSDQFHLTLRFIGEVDGPLADDVAMALAGIADAPFTLTLDGLGHFSHGRRPHALWAGVRKHPALRDLHARIENRLQAIGLPPERRNYAPHVTIARLKTARLKKAAPARIADYLQTYGAFATAPFAVNAFALFSSFLSHRGAIHTVEASYPLEQPAQPSVAAAQPT